VHGSANRILASYNLLKTQNYFWATVEDKFDRKETQGYTSIRFRYRIQA